MNIQRETLEQALRRKGFERKQDGHHIYYHHKYKGKETGAYTYFSHSLKTKDITRDLLTQTRKQLKLDTNAQVAMLANCPMDAEQYNRILAAKGILHEDPSGS